MRRQIVLAAQFEDFCAQVLERLNFSIQRDYLDRSDGHLRHVDIVATDADGDKRYIEIKSTREKFISLKRLRDWASQTSALGWQSESIAPLLIVSGNVDDVSKSWVEAEFRIEIWDREYLMMRAGSVGLMDTAQKVFLDIDKPTGRASASESFASLPPSQGKISGADLIDRLEAVPLGKPGAGEYETLCRDIIDYLFGDHLLDPREQSRLEDDLSIMDIVYRVKTADVFWATLTRDFRARVIVFECKNYSEPVSPLQVYTTERYVGANVLRPICFILTRKPAHPHAELAAFGAMRESGKLIIFIDDEDLKKMIRIRDAQLKMDEKVQPDNDPSIILDQKIYDFIARIPR